MNYFTTVEWIGIGLVILITGIPQDGLPIAGVTLSLLVLIWAAHGQTALSGS